MARLLRRKAATGRDSSSCACQPQPRHFLKLGFLMLLIAFVADTQTQFSSVERSLSLLKLATTKTKAKANSTVAKTPAEIAFGELELFASIAPSHLTRDDNTTISGLEELQSTLIRSLQFFWPTKEYPLKINLVLDDIVCSTSDECNNMTQTVKGLFDYSYHDNSQVKVHYNNLTDQNLYGCGYLIQQLIMLWADNFTDAKYIGFVDDDALFSRSIQPNDIFDDNGHPRAIVTSAFETLHGPMRPWKTAVQFAFHRDPKINGMTYFPVVVERAMLAEMRKEIMELNPHFPHFNEFYRSMIRRKNPGSTCFFRSFFSQFVLMMDYAFQSDTWKNKYDWHLETALCQALEFLPTECSPFPRVSVHAGYHWIYDAKMQAYSKTPEGREALVSEKLKKGYCHSLAPQLLGNHGGSSSHKDNNKRRCTQYNVSDLYLDGDWQFEGAYTLWKRDANASQQMVLANAHKRERLNPEREWDEQELAYIFNESSSKVQ